MPRRASLVVLASWLLACDGSEGDVLRERGARTHAKLLLHGRASPGGLAELAAMRQRITTVEQLPFDGMVIDLGFATNAFSNQPIDRAAAETAVNEVRATPFRRFTDNFQQLQLGLRNLDWYDDDAFAVLTANLTQAAELARRARLRGLFVDHQAYGANLWAFQAGGGRRFVDVQAKVTERAHLLMTSALTAFPEMQLLLAWGYSEVFRQVCIEGQALETHPYALYPAFLDGLLLAAEARKSGTSVVDAYLPAYPTRDPAHFSAYHDLIHFRWDQLVKSWRPNIVTHWDGSSGDGRSPWRTTPQLVCDRDTMARLGRDRPAGFGLMLDYQIAYGGTFALSPDFAGNHFTPAQFEHSVVAALARTDRYVWIWSESVRVPGLGTLEAPELPAAYLEALSNARRRAGLP